MKEEHMTTIVDMIDEVISNIDNEEVIESVKTRVNKFMEQFGMFAY
jgi:glycine hydroxymethyltransferase